MDIFQNHKAHIQKYVLLRTSLMAVTAIRVSTSRNPSCSTSDPGPSLGKHWKMAQVHGDLDGVAGFSPDQPGAIGAIWEMNKQMEALSVFQISK